MRSPAFIALATLATLATLTACGTKGPLTLPPKAQPASAAPAAVQPDHSSKAMEARQ